MTNEYTAKGGEFVELLEGEVWRPCIGFSRYSVSNLGRLYRHIKSRRAPIGLVVVQPTNAGYLRPRLISDSGVHSAVGIHLLVLEAFVTKPPEKVEPNHKNGIGSDNRLENLEWVTRSQNVLHSKHTLKAKRLLGPENHKTKLTAEQVQEIRRIYQRGSDFGAKPLARRFNVTDTAIRLIIRGTNWRHLQETV